MATVTEITEGQSLTEDRAGAKSVTRIFKVSGLTAGNYGILRDALGTSGIPAMNAAHPEETALYVSQRDVDIDSGTNTVAVVKCTYTLPDANGGGSGGGSGTGVAQVNVSATLTSSQTNEDKNGNLMTVSYTPSGGTAISQTGTVNKSIPQVVVSFKGVANLTSVAAKVATALTYVGKCNNGTWLGGAAGVWLCTSYNATSQDGGATWQDIGCEVAYDDDGHACQVAYIDPDTGRVPTDVVTNTGRKRFDIYDQVSFSAIA